MTARPLPVEGSEPPPLPLAFVLPGALIVVGLDLAALGGALAPSAALERLRLPLLAGLPWATLLLARRPAASLGFTRRRALAEFGWGMLAGSLWRGLSLGFNLWWLVGRVPLGVDPASWALGVAVVPLLEETFYRGFLTRSLQGVVGRWPAILAQAGVFCLSPSHWSQGWPALASIFVFGLVSGWLILRRGSIWAPLGAHSFANLLPSLLQAFA